VSYVNEIDIPAVERYEEARADCAQSTRRCEIKVTKKVLNWCVERNLLSENPIGKYVCESTNEETNPHRAFDLCEAHSLIAHAYPPIDLMLKVYLCTGMRRSELCSTKWGDVDLDGGLIHLRRDNTKTKAQRFVLLGPRLVELLREHRGPSLVAPPEDTPVFPTRTGASRYSTIWQSFNRTVTRAGVDAEGAHIHSLRVTAATLLYLDLEAPSVIVDLILGHGKVRDPKAPLSVRKYLKPERHLDKLRPYIERLEELILEDA